MSYGKARFNTIIDDADFGKILFFANTDGDSLVASDVWRFKVVDPAGLTVRDYPVSADYEQPLSPPGGYAAANDVDIPLDSTGTDWTRGTYTVYVKVTIDGNENIFSETVDFQPAITYEEVNAKDADGNYYGILTGEVDCVAKEVTFTDGSDNDGWTIDDYHLIVQPPLIPNQAAPSPTDSTAEDTPVVTSFTWTNVTYTAMLQVVRLISSDETETNGMIIDRWESLIATASADIRCGDQSYCDLLPCADSYFNAAYQEACQKGGWSKVNTKTWADLQALMVMLNLYDLHNRCNDIAEAKALRLKIEALVGENCDCGCGGSTTSVEPRPI